MMAMAMAAAMAGMMPAAAMPAATMPAARAAPMAGMDHAAPPCPAKPAALPPELAGWSHPIPLAAGATVAGAPMLALGAGVSAALPAMAGLAFALPPGKAGAPGSHGGLFAFVAPAAARYRVALGAPAWIDVVRDGKAVPSVAHDHGPACSGVRKMVDFDLAPGRYVLQVADAATGRLPLMVAITPVKALR